MQEEQKNSGRLVEEGERRLASLTEAKLASLSQATREEYGQQLEQTEAALKRLREELSNSGRLVEEGKQQLASLTEAVEVPSVKLPARNMASNWRKPFGSMRR